MPMGRAKKQTWEQGDYLLESGVCIGQLQLGLTLQKWETTKTSQNCRPDTDTAWMIVMPRSIPSIQMPSGHRDVIPMMTEYHRVADDHIMVIFHGSEQEAVVEAKSDTEELGDTVMNVNGLVKNLERI